MSKMTIHKKTIDYACNIKGKNVKLSVEINKNQDITLRELLDELESFGMWLRNESNKTPSYLWRKNEQ